MSALSIKALPPGYKPCLKCGNNGATAFSEEVTYFDMSDPAYPEYYAFNHWCDPGYEDKPYMDEDLIALHESMRSYTQGHSVLHGNIYIPGVPGNTKDDIRQEWNRMNKQVIAPKRWLARLLNRPKSTD